MTAPLDILLRECDHCKSSLQSLVRVGFFVQPGKDANFYLHVDPSFFLMYLDTK